LTLRRQGCVQSDMTHKATRCWSALYAGLGNCEQLGHELEQQFVFLQSLKLLPSRIVNFGCSAKWDEATGYDGGVEPFALMWTLGASEVFVVDKNESSINVLKKRADELREKYPECFDAYRDSFKYLVADMTSQEQMDQLFPEYFGLVYCSRVLLNIEHDYGLEGVKSAVRGMARAVRPGGWIVSHEADALEPYPVHYIGLFEQVGCSKSWIVRQPEFIGIPNREVEYAVYKRRV